MLRTQSKGAERTIYLWISDDASFLPQGMDDRFSARSEAGLRLTMRALAEVLEEAGSKDVVDYLPWAKHWRDGVTQSQPKSFPEAIAERCVRAYSLAFQLADQVEENATIQTLRSIEDEERRFVESGSWEHTLELLRKLGKSEDEIRQNLAALRLEPVLTAHPTEAKRQTVLEHQRRLYRRLVDLENSMWTRAERAALINDLKTDVDRLVRTGEIYLEKPSLADERRMVLHYLVNVFPSAILRSQGRLRAAWTHAGFDPTALADSEALPRTVLGNWVGGDRDGHPFVTPAFTEETLLEFRKEALRIVDESLEGLAMRMSLSVNRQPTPPLLTQAIQSLSERLKDAGQAAMNRNPEEPWRQYVNLLRAALPSSNETKIGELENAGDLERALVDLRTWLRDTGAQRLAEHDVNPVLSLVRSFGFHLAIVDIRQNSAYYDRAMAQALELAGVEDGGNYPSWTEAQRRPLLDQELATRRPLVRPIDVKTREASDVLELFRRLTRHIQLFGAEGVGALIVSMTRSAEDLLAVFVLAREGDLMRYDEDGQGFLPLEVVPLFETIDDLERAPAIMNDYLVQPVVQRTLQRRAEARGLERPIQQVMIGYSDSSKDGGIAASLWGLNRCQAALVKVAETHGVDLQFFHGRGGTIGRGAGPTHRFVRALPPNALRGGFRVTEQGETIRQKYANLAMAAHHIELLQSSALARRALDTSSPEDPPHLVTLMDDLATRCRESYVALIESEGFVAFFERATPIDAIENSRIGSRPARRPGERKLSNLRAIPWVFAWNQARFVLPGWYGLGTGLLDLQAQNPEGFEALRAAKSEEQRWAPLHYMLSNAATAWATASLPIMQRYAELAADLPTAGQLQHRIEEEHARAGEALARIYGRPLHEARHNIHRVISFRSEALEPLHDLQIRLLKAWRADGAEPRDPRVPELLRTINAISSGLGVTG